MLLPHIYFLLEFLVYPHYGWARVACACGYRVCANHESDWYVCMCVCVYVFVCVCARVLQVHSRVCPWCSMAHISHIGSRHLPPAAAATSAACLKLWVRLTSSGGRVCRWGWGGGRRAAGELGMWYGKFVSEFVPEHQPLARLRRLYSAHVIHPLTRVHERLGATLVMVSTWHGWKCMRGFVSRSAERGCELAAVGACSA